MSSIKLYHITFYGCHLCCCSSAIFVVCVYVFIFEVVYPFTTHSVSIWLLIFAVYIMETHTRARARRRLIIECWVLQYKKPNVYTAIKQILVEFVSTLRIFNSSSFDFQVISWIREILLLLAVYYARSPVLFIIIIYVLLFRALTLHQTQFIRANISSST